MNYIDDKFLLEKMRVRDRAAHKGNFGKVLIYAGSEGMAGAAILCGTAALRTGSGLVRFLITESRKELQPIFQSVLYEATCVYYHPGNHLDDDLFSEYDAICCGCGLGKSREAIFIIEKILTQYSGILVLDADALNIISENARLQDAVHASSATIIMTPHIGEARRLLGPSSKIETQDEREKAAIEISEKYNCICVLKGAGTLIASHKDTILFENTTGNPGMATGGAGDVLTGVIASLAGQGYSPIDAACMGVFLHGKAGDIAAEKLGEMSVMSRDILSSLPDAIKLYYQKGI